MSILGAVVKKLGPSQEDPRGWAHFVCPKCQSKGKPKFGVNVGGRRFGCFHCHWCGDLWELLDYLGIDQGVLRSAGRSARPKLGPDHNYPNITIPGFVPIGRSASPSVVERKCLEFVAKRGRTPLSKDKITSLGWGYSTDPALFWRLIIPVVMDGVVVQYLARALDPDQEPKELPAPNAPGCPRKGEVLWGQPVRPGLPLVIVEGVWDALAVEDGYPLATATAILGTSLSSYLVGWLLRKKPGTTILFLDGDEAGREGSVKLARRLLKRHVQVLVARPSAGQDPKNLTSSEIFRTLTHADPAAGWLLQQAASRRPFPAPAHGYAPRSGGHPPR